MSTERVGYMRLIERFSLPALPRSIISVIDTAVRGRARTHFSGQETQQFQPSYRPEETTEADLQFALRYEGVNLQVLALLFAKRDRQDIEPWIASRPDSVYARRAAFLYEWLTGDSLPIEVSSTQGSAGALRGRRRRRGTSHTTPLPRYLGRSWRLLVQPRL